MAGRFEVVGAAAEVAEEEVAVAAIETAERSLHVLIAMAMALSDEQSGCAAAGNATEVEAAEAAGEAPTVTVEVASLDGGTCHGCTSAPCPRFLRTG